LQTPPSNETIDVFYIKTKCEVVEFVLLINGNSNNVLGEYYGLASALDTEWFASETSRVLYH